MSYTDAIAQIGQIQTQIASLSSAFTPSASAPSATSTAASTATAGPSFATELAQAQSGELSQAQALSTGSTGQSLSSGEVYSPYQSLSPGDVYSPSQLLPTSGGVSSPQALSPGASQMLTSGQQQFASQLAADTGMSPQVIGAWLLAEESGGAATARQSAGNNDWLNIGYTDSATYGSADSVWSDPTTAANATAGWLHGQNTIPGYGTASSGIQSILATAGQSPEAQISAIQQSGWASSAYPDLPSLYSQVAG